MKVKKIFVSIVLTGILMVTGCTSSKETKEKQEENTVVYCSDCGDESSEVTKFCSECGVEAKWLAEKPDIVEDKENIDKKEEVKEDNNDEESNKKGEVNKKTKGQCYFCQSYVSKESLVELKGLLLCTECNSVDEKTCFNGFEDLCEGCIDCKEYNFTYEQAISIAEKYYGVKENTDSFITADTEPSYDSRGMYYKMWAKSKEMIDQGGNGIIFVFKTYEDGTIIEY